MKNTMKKRLTILTALLGISLTFTACASIAQASVPPAGTPIQNLPTNQTATVSQAQPAPTANTPVANAPAAPETAALPQTSDTMTQQNSYIGEEKALQIALEHAGTQATDLAYSYVKLDYDDGIWVYDTEFYSANKEYDYEIEAVTGNILSYDYDMESNYLPPADNTQAANASVSLETAKASALAQVSGANDSHIKIYQDYDDGRIVYEGKIIYNNMEYEFEIDAATGNFLEWDAESIFD